MKFFILCIFVCALAWIGSSSPIDHKRILINRPKGYGLVKRSPQYESMYVKGHKGTKGYNPTPPPLRKGQYMCGNKICRLQPGEIPKGCNGVCQYPVN